MNDIETVGGHRVKGAIRGDAITFRRRSRSILVLIRDPDDAHLRASLQSLHMEQADVARAHQPDAKLGVLATHQ